MAPHETTKAMDEVWLKQLSGSSLILHTSLCPHHKYSALNVTWTLAGRVEGCCKTVLLSPEGPTSSGHTKQTESHRQLHPAGLAELGGWTGWISAAVSKELQCRGPAMLPGVCPISPQALQGSGTGATFCSNCVTPGMSLCYEDTLSCQPYRHYGRSGVLEVFTKKGCWLLLQAVLCSLFCLPYQEFTSYLSDSIFVLYT